MLQLLLLRHAKSNWDDPALTDHDRPLSKRGTKAAGLIGRYIAKKRLKPEQVICSDAVRTRATFTLVALEFGGAPMRASFHSELYLAEPAVLLEHIRGADLMAKTVLIIGHNPGIHALSLALIGSGNRKQLRDMAMKYPTAALSVIGFDVSRWKDIRPGGGTLSSYVTPRDLD